jgi:hypothetical protein
VLLAVRRSPGATLTINLVVRDGALRRPGTDCSGSGPFLHIHRGASYEIADAATGSVLVSGALPGGTAVKTFNVAFKVPRVPTVCRLVLPVRLPERDRYSLKLATGEPIPFARSQIDSASSSVTLGVP